MIHEQGFRTYTEHSRSQIGGPFSFTEFIRLCWYFNKTGAPVDYSMNGQLRALQPPLMTN